MMSSSSKRHTYFNIKESTAQGDGFQRPLLTLWPPVEYYISPEIIQLNITDSAAVKNTVKQIVNDFGRIDILVNNAGIYFDGSADISEKDFLYNSMTVMVLVTK